MEQLAFDQIPEVAVSWLEQGRRVSIATVVATWGSAPRPLGSQLVVDADGAFEGSVSGGCVEAAVILAAQDSLSDGKKRRLTFGVSEGDAFAVGLACGGEIEVLVDPVGDDFGAGEGMRKSQLLDLVSARAQRKIARYHVDMKRRLTVVDVLDHQAHKQVAPSSPMQDDIFTHYYLPQRRLIIVGAVHVAQALLPMAQLLGLEVHLIDPRGAFLTEARFGQAKQYAGYPDEVLDQIGFDQQTGLVVLAHDPKIDDPALEAALCSEAFYIGALGSRRTQKQRLERLIERGFHQQDLARIHGPVGLDIKALGPAEIAVSIIAQIVASYRNEDHP